MSPTVARARRLRREATAAERLLWKALRGLGLNIRRQAPIGRYIADFACHGARLVVEIDGYWHEDPDRAARDAARADWLRSQGYRVLRFPEKQVRDHLPEVIEQIRTAITPFPLDGGRAGDGGANLSAPKSRRRETRTAPPPTPTLPPSRGKGVRP